MQYSICVARSTDTGYPHIGVDDDVHRTNDCIYAIKKQSVYSIEPCMQVVRNGSA